MNTYTARVHHARTERTDKRGNFGTPLSAARHLAMLMSMHGWPEEEENTAQRLASGEVLEFKGFHYSVGDDSV